MSDLLAERSEEAVHAVIESSPDRQFGQEAIGVGAVRKFCITYHNICRFLLKPWECAVFGRMTYWRSPFGR